MNLIEHCKANPIDYVSLGSLVRRKPGDFEKSYWLSVVIPVMGRTQYTPIICSHLRYAIERAKELNIMVTIVEHSEQPEHATIVPSWANYIWVHKNGKPFNKCLAYNIGVLHGPKAANYLFHDIDILMGPNFFRDLEKNYTRHDGLAMQAYTGRRLIQATEQFTVLILNSIESYETAMAHRPNIPNTAGAAGGSILVNHTLFFAVGGFDAELFTEYSVEDQFFFDKLNLVSQVGFADDPAIEMVHLWHPLSFNRTTKKTDWDAFHAFADLKEEEKLAYVNFKAELLNPFL